VGRQRCESIENLNGEPCPCYATWVIQVGTRDHDKQHSCGRHLHSACLTMSAAEARTGVKLTIQLV
jgi:hypothetical protein